MLPIFFPVLCLPLLLLPFVVWSYASMKKPEIPHNISLMCAVLTAISPGMGSSGVFILVPAALANFACILLPPLRGKGVNGLLCRLLAFLIVLVSGCLYLGRFIFVPMD